MPNMYPKPFNVPLEFGAPGKESIDEQTRGLLLDERTPRIVYNPNFAESQGLPAEGEATFSKTPQDFVHSISSDKEVWTSDGVFPSEFEHNRMLAGGTPEDQQVVENPKEPKIDWWKGVKLYVQQAGEQIVNTLKKPGEAYKGNLSSEEITQGGIDIAMLVGGLSTPIPKPGLGLFGGRVTSRELSRAQHIEENVGGTVRDIKEYSGLERGADRRWLYEFDDSVAKIDLTDKKFTKYEDVHGYPVSIAFLKDVLEHPELYKRYPELKDFIVKKFSFDDALKYHPAGGIDTEASGYWMGLSQKQIHLNTNRVKETGMQMTLIHEVQHAIQALDKRPSEVVERLTKTEKDKALGHFAKDEVLQFAEKEGIDPSLVFELIKTQDSLLNKKWAKNILDAADLRLYQALRGEVEARNVENRLEMTARERQILPGKRTEDIPRSEQIIKKEGGEALFGVPSKEIDVESIRALRRASYENVAFNDNIIIYKAEDFDHLQKMGYLQKQGEHWGEEIELKSGGTGFRVKLTPEARAMMSKVHS